MSKLDDLIKDALSAEEQDLLRQTEELGWFALGLRQFTGKLGWVTWVIMIVQAIMALVGAWCCWRFFQTTDVLVALKWGLSGATLLILSLVLKTSIMPQMQADRVMRELKRVELLIARQRGD